MSHPLDNLLQAQKRGRAVGIPSICSAHPWVLKTALCGGQPVLIESTCNQVNQLGGYTGMTPADFITFVTGLAAANTFPVDRIIFGGDHLGPSPWQDLPAETAMQRAEEMIRAYVQAGFTKIHLDASMRLGDDDPGRPLDLELVARRAARLANAAESVPDRGAGLRYVIGTEVPVPGGATAHEESVSVTSAVDAQRTLEVTQAAFVEIGLERAWARVIAEVVQPGVEFGDDFILDYDPRSAQELAQFSETTPFIFEAHSTDYQQRPNLRALVRDHFAILKVGPALTYAFREAIFALAMIETELFRQEECSRLVDSLDTAMQQTPIHWQNHYHGDAGALAIARKYSLSDRSRYYWHEPAVQAALGKLFSNLGTENLPLSLLSQYMPDLLPGIRSGKIPNSSRALVSARIRSVLDDYSAACGMDPAAATGGWSILSP